MQFHPEMDGVVIRRLIEHRRKILQDDAVKRGRAETVDEVLGRSTDAPEAELVLRNFVRHFVARR